MPRLSPDKWKEIETLYIYGVNENGNLFYPTLEWLSDRFDIAISNISRKSKKNQWDLYRERSQNKTGELTQIKKTTAINQELQTQNANANAKTQKDKTSIIPAKPEEMADVMADFDIACLNQTRDILEITRQTIESIKNYDDDSKKVWLLDMVTKALERAQKIGKSAIGETHNNESQEKIITIEYVG